MKIKENSRNRYKIGEYNDNNSPSSAVVEELERAALNVENKHPKHDQYTKGEHARIIWRSVDTDLKTSTWFYISKRVDLDPQGWIRVNPAESRRESVW